MPRFDRSIWTRIPEGTPCGAPVYVTEFSTWRACGCPDPLTGEDMSNVQVEVRGDGDNRYWVGRSPSGVFFRIFND